jgi:hypothetical protein
LIKTRGWKVLPDDANYIWIANHEENIKSRNIVEKIKFERKIFVSYRFEKTDVCLSNLDVAPVMKIV